MASEAPGRPDGRTGTSGAPADAELRPIRPADLPQVLEIERRSFSIPWTERAFRHLMGRRDAGILVADAGREGAVGYAAWWTAGDEAELGDLAVRVDRRRRGIGRALVEGVARTARGRGATSLFLQVRAGNEAARALYLDAGFREVGRRKRYYRIPTEDAVVLARSLAGEPD